MRAALLIVGISVGGMSLAAGAHAAEVDELAAKLSQPRPFGIDEYRKLFLAMWAQVPNWKSGDPLWIKRAEPPYVPAPKGQPRTKRPPPHQPEKLDWIAALEAIDLAQLGEAFAFEGLPKVELPEVAPEKREALRADALLVVRTMHALADTHRAEAVEPMFKLAFVLDGVFRDECGRAIRAIGDAAVAPLVRLQYVKGTGIAFGKQRRYAVYQLDRMDRARPSKAVDAAPDDRLRAALLKAYGDVRAPDAVEAVLGQVTAQSHRVRREARAAFRRYVEGPPPPPAPMRKRRLPGGKEEAEEKADYLTYREVAELALQKRVAEAGVVVPEHATALQMFEAIIAKDDAERAAEWERAYAAAQQKLASGDLAGAVGDYEFILAHDPTNERRGEMSATFAKLAGERAKSGALAEASGLYWKAALLRGDAPEAKAWQAESAWLDAERARKEGRTDEGALRSALRLYPDHAGAKSALRAIETARTAHRAKSGAIIIGSVLAGALVAAWLLLRKSR